MIAEPQVALDLSDLQRRVLAVPEEYDLALLGGRGGGKTFTLALLAMRNAELYGADARALFLRQTFGGTLDFEVTTRQLYGRVYGSAARYNASTGVWRFPSGGTLEINQIEDLSDLNKFQGRSVNLLLIDEAGQWGDPTPLDLLRSNLRSPAPVRVVVSANPGGPGHHWLLQRYVIGSSPWQPFREKVSDREWVRAISTFEDNPFLDREAYNRQLLAATATDPELQKGWVHGDWLIARGAFFAGVLDEHRNAFDPWEPLIRLDDWGPYLAHDWGSAAPSVTFACLRSPGAVGLDGQWYPRGSVLLLDEVATNEPGSLTRGLRLTVPETADRIRELSARWRIAPRGVADDSIFAKTGSAVGTIADEFRRAGVYFRPCKKGDRKGGWEVMRRLLGDAGKLDCSGLYISRACAYAWQTLPFLARDPRRPEDLDTTGSDHAADATRYACLYERSLIRTLPTSLG